MSENSETPTADAADKWLKSPEKHKSPEERYKDIVDRVKAWTAKHNLHTDHALRYHSDDSRFDFSVHGFDLHPGVFSVTAFEQDISFKERKGLAKLLPGGGPRFKQLGSHDWTIGVGPGNEFVIYYKIPDSKSPDWKIEEGKWAEQTEGGWWSANGKDPNPRLGPGGHPRSAKFKEVDVLKMAEKMVAILEGSRPHIHAGGMQNYPNLKPS